MWTAARLGARSAGAGDLDADDVAQMVAERLTRQWGRDHVVRARSRGPVAWRAYVQVAGRNAYRDHLRHEGRLKARERLATLGGTSEPLPDRPGTMRPGRPTPADEVAARFAILELIDTNLSGRPRQVLSLIFVDGLTSREIADRLGMSVRSVNRCRQSGIDQLRELLAAPPTAMGETG